MYTFLSVIMVKKRKEKKFLLSYSTLIFHIYKRTDELIYEVSLALITQDLKTH